MGEDGRGVTGAWTRGSGCGLGRRTLTLAGLGLAGALSATLLLAPLAPTAARAEGAQRSSGELPDVPAAIEAGMDAREFEDAMGTVEVSSYGFTDHVAQDLSLEPWFPMGSVEIGGEAGADGAVSGVSVRMSVPYTSYSVYELTKEGELFACEVSEEGSTPYELVGNAISDAAGAERELFEGTIADVGAAGYLYGFDSSDAADVLARLGVGECETRAELYTKGTPIAAAANVL